MFDSNRPDAVGDVVAEQEQEHRLTYYGKYRGRVASIGTGKNDKEGRIGQIRASVPDVYGDMPDDQLPWANCAVPFAGDQYGFLMLPKEKDGVWIEFEGGNKDFPVWSGCWFAQNMGLPGPVAAEVRVLRTPKGHQVVLDDDGNVVTLEHKDGQKITLASDSISLEVKGGCKIEIGKSSVKINDTALEVSK